MKLPWLLLDLAAYTPVLGPQAEQFESLGLERSGRRRHEERAAVLGGDDIHAQGAQVFEEGTETQDRESVIGATSDDLPRGGFGWLCRFDGILPGGGLACLIMLLEQNQRERISQKRSTISFS